MSTVADYMAKPYRVLFYPGEDGWFVKVHGLDGCISQGDTLEEACYMIVEAMELWIEVAIEDGDEIPAPSHPLTDDDWAPVTMGLQAVRQRAAGYKGIE